MTTTRLMSTADEITCSGISDTGTLRNIRIVDGGRGACQKACGCTVESGAAADGKIGMAQKAGL